MKLLICSDIHGDFECAKRALDTFKAEGCDKLVIPGDLLSHGPRNDLPGAYAPKSVIALLNENKEYIISVRGNCDTEVDQMVLDFPILADYSYLYVDGLSIFMTHGHKFNTETPPKLLPGEIMLHGHTHIPTVVEFGNANFYINPGSVSLPKACSDKGYIIYEDREFTYLTLDGAVYDVLDLK